MEYKFFAENVPYVSTPEFHADRERAPHLEQDVHFHRLVKAREYIRHAVRDLGAEGVTDLGCGDGGLLSLIQSDGIRCWGFDFQPSNQAGWEERGVTALLVDIFDPDTRDHPFLAIGEVAVCTEVLEHLADPHGVLRWLSGKARFLVASSPWNETPESHDVCHAWGWNRPGYHKLLDNNGWNVIGCEIVGQFHVVLAKVQQI